MTINKFFYSTVVFQNSPQMKRSSFFEHPDHPEEKSNQKFVVVVERTDFNLNSKQKDFYCKICQVSFFQCIIKI